MSDDSSYPAAVLASVVPPRQKLSAYPEPFASMMKAMWERSDPAAQKQDQAEIAKLSVGSSSISLAGIKPGNQRASA